MNRIEKAVERGLIDKLSVMNTIDDFCPAHIFLEKEMEEVNGKGSKCLGQNQLNCIKCWATEYDEIKEIISYVITEWYDEHGDIVCNFQEAHHFSLPYVFGLYRGDLLVDVGRSSHDKATEPLEEYRKDHNVDNIKYFVRTGKRNLK